MSKSVKLDSGRLAEVFKALSNPHRLRILHRLMTDCCRQGVSCCGTEDEVTSCVGDLGKDLGIAPSTVSHHIKELTRAGLIRVERQGQFVCCCVDARRLGELAAFFAPFGA